MATPHYVVVVIGVEVQLLEAILAARKNDGETKAVRETSLVIDAAPSSIISLSEVRNNEP